MPELHIIRSVSFDANGSVAIEYVTPARDLRANGLEVNHVLFVPADPDYEDEIDDIREAALALLEDALEDVQNVPAMDLSEPEPDDDEDDD